MTLYCIPGDRADLLRQAAHDQGLAYVAVHPQQFHALHLPALGPGDMLYRAVSAAQHPAARVIEQRLLNNHVATFHHSFPATLDVGDAHACYLQHQQAHVPVPQRVWPLTRERQQLREYVNHLGGFPVVLKVIGGSRGLGVMKITNLASLFSVVDHVLVSGAQVVMQEYIDVGTPAHSHRAIVVGDTVVSAYTLVQSEADEFRSNVGLERKARMTLTLTPQETALMVRAVHALGIELGAVDFVRRQGEVDNIAIFEVNFPFDFVPAVRVLNEPVHQHMVRYLAVKARAHLQAVQPAFA